MRFPFFPTLVAAVLLGSPTGVIAQDTGTLAADFQTDWVGQHEQIIGIADAMPADGFDYRPTDAQRSYAEQILHIVETGQFLFDFLGSPVVPPDINLDVTNKADVVQALDQFYAYGAAVLEGFDDAQMTEAVDMPQGFGRSTRARVVAFTLGHTTGSYGQMAVYLRLNDIVPPASRGM
jgi:uncharacterized damage-inducible protein DinB